MVDNFVFVIRYLVIQRSFATKDFGCIKRMFPRFFGQALNNTSSLRSEWQEVLVCVFEILRDGQDDSLIGKILFDTLSYWEYCSPLPFGEIWIGLYHQVKERREIKKLPQPVVFRLREQKYSELWCVLNSWSDSETISETSETFFNFFWNSLQVSRAFSWEKGIKKVDALIHPLSCLYI